MKESSRPAAIAYRSRLTPLGGSREAGSGVGSCRLKGGLSTDLSLVSRRYQLTSNSGRSQLVDAEKPKPGRSI